MAKAKDIHWNGKISAKDFSIPDEIFDKARELGEEVLRKRIESDIYGVDRRGDNTWVHHKKYQRRHNLPSSVYSYVKGDVVWINANGEANDSIWGDKKFVSEEPGAFLNLLNSGKLGFLTTRPRYSPSFPRPALSNAQADVDSAEFKAKIQKLFDDYYQ